MFMARQGYLDTFMNQLAMVSMPVLLTATGNRCQSDRGFKKKQDSQLKDTY
jgi:hypothetical protein